VRKLGWSSLLLAAACTFTPGASHTLDPARDGGDQDASGVPRIRELIATDKVAGGPHEDFPALVALSGDWLRTREHGGEVVHVSGADLWFSADAAGDTPLAFEVEQYDATTGTLVAWIKIPALVPGATVHLHVGDPERSVSLADPPAVWTAGYVGVWHLSSTEVGDSTASTTITGNGASPVPGKIAGARAFGGTGSAISIGAGPAIDNVFANGGTVEAWFRAVSWGESGLGRIFDKGAGSAIAIGMCNANVPGGFLFGHGFTTSGVNWCTPEGSIALDTWTHVAAVFDASSSTNSPEIYIDGLLQPVPTQAVTGTSRSDASTDLYIGDRTTGGRAFEGILDELRFARTIRSGPWILTTFENQRDPAAFWQLRELD
jgi:biopolymer transport protein ExbB